MLLSYDQSLRVECRVILRTTLLAGLCTLHEILKKNVFIPFKKRTVFRRILSFNRIEGCFKTLLIFWSRVLKNERLSLTTELLCNIKLQRFSDITNLRSTRL
jgi:hypothetical protein